MSVVTQYNEKAAAYKQQASAHIKTVSHSLTDLLSEIQAASGAMSELQNSSGKVSHEDQEFIDDIERRLNGIQNAARNAIEQMGALEALELPDPPKLFP
jgi:hypothetical protein